MENISHSDIITDSLFLDSPMTGNNSGMGLRIKELRKKKKWTQAQLAEATEFTQGYIASIESTKSDKSPSMSTLVKIAEALECQVSDLFAPTFQIPLMGKVGAGQAIEKLDDNVIEYVDTPPNATKESVAVVVDGDSMYPAFEDQSIIYYSRNLPPENLINRRCVVRLATGETYVKVLRKGSRDDLWTLQSINFQYADIEDVVIEWAAPIDWVKPHL